MTFEQTITFCLQLLFSLKDDIKLTQLVPLKSSIINNYYYVIKCYLAFLPKLLAQTKRNTAYSSHAISKEDIPECTTVFYAIYCLVDDMSMICKLTEHCKSNDVYNLFCKSNII
jgi:hypothetical protein